MKRFSQGSWNVLSLAAVREGSSVAGRQEAADLHQSDWLRQNLKGFYGFPLILSGLHTSRDALQHVEGSFYKILIYFYFLFCTLDSLKTVKPLSHTPSRSEPPFIGSPIKPSRAPNFFFLFSCFLLVKTTQHLLSLDPYLKECGINLAWLRWHHEVRRVSVFSTWNKLFRSD